MNSKSGLIHSNFEFDLKLCFKTVTSVLSRLHYLYLAHFLQEVQGMEIVKAKSNENTQIDHKMFDVSIFSTFSADKPQLSWKEILTKI